jgi:hypothetical protein
MSTSSIGLTLQYSTDNRSSWITLGCVLDLGYDGATKEIKETTCLSQSNRWKTFFGTFVDAGEITVTLDFSKTMFPTLLGLIDDQDPIDVRMAVPDGTDITDPTTCSRFDCDMLLSKGPGLTFASDGDRVKMPLTLKLSGQPTFTPAGS